MTHIGVGKSCGGVQRGAPSANVATICHPPRSCVAPVLIMLFLVLRIGSVQYVMNLLADVLNALNEVVHLGKFRLDMSQIGLSIDK